MWTGLRASDFSFSKFRCQMKLIFNGYAAVQITCNAHRCNLHDHKVCFLKISHMLGSGPINELKPSIKNVGTQSKWDALFQKDPKVARSGKILKMNYPHSWLDLFIPFYLITIAFLSDEYSRRYGRLKLTSFLLLRANLWFKFRCHV